MINKMKILCMTIILFFSLALDTYAQFNFQEIIGDVGGSVIAKSVQQTNDGGYILTGNAYRSGGNRDVYLIKLKSNGDTLWIKTFGGLFAEYGNSVQQTNDSGYIIAGYTNSFGMGIYNVYLIKTDINGDTSWAKTFGGTGEDVGNSVQQTTDGGYIIAGTTTSFGAGNDDVFLIKTNSTGDTLWTKTFGGANDDEGNSVQQTIDNGYIIICTSKSFGAGYNDMWLIKTDSSGNIIWTKTYGGALGDFGISGQQTSDSGYIIAGYSNSFGMPPYDYYLIKTNSYGDTLWSKTYGGESFDEAYAVHQTTDGGYIISGISISFGFGNADVYLIRTDGNGDTLWTKFYGSSGTDYAFSVHETSDNGFITCGWSYGFTPAADYSYIIKTDKSGDSGCNQGTPSINITLPVTIINSPAPSISSFNAILTTPSTLIGSGATVISLCDSSTNGIGIYNQDDFITISPNPSSGNFKIILGKNFSNYSVEIINLYGTKIFEEICINESIKEINLTFVTSGIYFVRVFDGGNKFIHKVIIEF